MERASSVLNALMKDLGLETGLALYRIRTDWRKAFQGPISLHSYPSGLGGGILQVNVDSPVWLQQLNFLKRELMSKLDSHGIKEIRFKIGRISPANRTRPSSCSALSVSEDERFFIDGMVSRFDEELGSSIRDAMERWVLKRSRK